METGVRGVQLRDVRDLGELYGLPREEREHLTALARGARQKAWYDSYPLPDEYKDYYGMESGASGLRWVDVDVIPGLLQTADYTRELLTVLAALPDYKDLHIEYQIKIRHERQQRLWGGGDLRLNVLIGEAALWHRAGSPRIMADQMMRLLSAADLANVELRVLRSTNGLAAAGAGPFTLLSFPARALQDMLFREQAQYALIADQETVAGYAELFESLSASAESPQQSTDFIEAVRKYWEQNMA